jgi:hypothetical protein
LSQEKNKHNIDLLCPTCDHKNKVYFSSDIKCKECNKTLIGYTYKIFIVPALVVIGLSAMSGVVIDDTLNLNRVSVKTEFNMMVECINRNSSDKNEVNDCVCAVESLSGFLDAEQLRFRDSSWKSRELQSRYNSCKN